MVELTSWLKYLERYLTPYSTWNIQRGSVSVTVRARDIGEAQKKALPLLRRAEGLICEDCRKMREKEILRITQGERALKIER